MQTKVIESGPAGPVLVGEWNKKADSTPIVLIGHMDTVFSDGTARENPFRIDEEGHAHGPGVLDMKAGLVIAIYAVKALQAVGYDKHPIKCIFAGDEEKIHSLSNAKVILTEEIKGAAAAFNFETGYMDDGLVVGRKGGGMAVLTVHGVAATLVLHLKKGGVRSWRCLTRSWSWKAKMIWSGESSSTAAKSLEVPILTLSRESARWSSPSASHQ